MLKNFFEGSTPCPLVPVRDETVGANRVPSGGGEAEVPGHQDQGDRRDGCSDPRGVHEGHPREDPGAHHG